MKKYMLTCLICCLSFISFNSRCAESGNDLGVINEIEVAGSPKITPTVDPVDPVNGASSAGYQFDTPKPPPGSKPPSPNSSPRIPVKPKPRSKPPTRPSTPEPKPPTRPSTPEPKPPTPNSSPPGSKPPTPNSSPRITPNSSASSSRRNSNVDINSHVSLAADDGETSENDLADINISASKTPTTTSPKSPRRTSASSASTIRTIVVDDDVNSVSNSLDYEPLDVDSDSENNLNGRFSSRPMTTDRSRQHGQDERHSHPLDSHRHGRGWCVPYQYHRKGQCVPVYRADEYTRSQLARQEQYYARETNAQNSQHAQEIETKNQEITNLKAESANQSYENPYHGLAIHTAVDLIAMKLCKGFKTPSYDETFFNENDVITLATTTVTSAYRFHSGHKNEVEVENYVKKLVTDIVVDNLCKYTGAKAVSLSVYGINYLCHSYNGTDSSTANLIDEETHRRKIEFAQIIVANATNFFVGHQLKKEAKSTIDSYFPD